MKGSFWQNWDKGLAAGVVYATAVLVLGGTLNYVLPSSPTPTASPFALEWVTWVALYAPLGLMTLAAGWNITDFGVHLNRRTAFAAIAALVGIGLLMRGLPLSWKTAAVEAFARTSEEVFFRGFLYALLLRLFHGRKGAWFLAAVVSSLLFAAVHTQTFQPSFFGNNPDTPVGSTILAQLLNVFMVGLLIALLRYWTDSILPGALIHAGLLGGILTIPFTLLIYFILLAWAWMRKEGNIFLEPPLMQ